MSSPTQLHAGDAPGAPRPEPWGLRGDNSPGVILQATQGHGEGGGLMPAVADEAQDASVSWSARASGH